ncbi:WD40-repeat-containing domain protein [Protomyces lactucae-debilis]|uniref:Ribosome biogenesis protein YTM1 n=1 Tax=Protomyces lactucae-debilis TaxID=2754530 RepID=A0A1Y2FGI5_PROLT|nr:WD40-repeat-containing domain protein [Protomyces lactucae-debilis]ORY81935.1 WD40-repeat-containing domain protein [Protomyces lactucae-debilis]
METTEQETVAAPGTDTLNVQINFTTKDASVAFDQDAPILVPTSLKRYGLSEVVNHLLGQQDEPVPFSFLIDGELLSTSVQDFLTKRGLSSETVLNVEYIRSILPPSFLASYPHDDWISAVALQGQDIVTGSYDSLVRVWDQSQHCKATGIGHTNAIKAVAYAGSLTGQQANLATASMDRTLRLWQLHASGDALTCTAELRGHVASVESCDLHGTTLVSGSSDGILGLWDTSDELGQPYIATHQAKRKRQRGTGVGVLTSRQLKQTHSQPISQVMLNPQDASLAYSSSWDKSLIATDLTTMLPITTIQTGSPLFSLLSIPSLSIVLTGGQRSVQVHDLRSNQLTRSTLQGHGNFVSSLARAPIMSGVSNNAYLFASGSYDGDVRVWDLRNDRSLYVIGRTKQERKERQSTGSNQVMCVAWGEMGIVSGGEDCQLQINRGVHQSITASASA